MTAVMPAILRFGPVVTFAQAYDRFRPRPPAALLDVLTRLADIERPRLVVDLGSGTGLSARAWVGRADRVVGIEPDGAMRAVAEAQGGGVEYVAADSTATGLPDMCADVVTASQALHWMEPEPTFAEVGRILHRGGVFAAYDYDGVPVIHPEVDAAYEALLDAAVALRQETGLISPWTSRPALRKSEHLARMRESGQFRYVREFVAHSVEEGDAERLIGGARSMGAIEVHRDRLPLDDLEATARRVLGTRTVPFWFGYRVRIGIR
jgi:SAM-dependent methyltransferase